MVQLPHSADVVVIKTGVVGSAAVAHPADLDWRSILQLDKGPLPDPGGSTGHASDLVFRRLSGRCARGTGRPSRGRPTRSPLV